MEPDRRNRITDLYYAALQLTPAEQAAFMNTACDGDQTLRQEVESLLAVECPSAGQRIFVVRREDYVYLVPFVEDEHM